jgi:acid phosphatase family membrane protein YuiD
LRFFQELYANRVLWAGALAWLVAQGLKVVFTALLEKRWGFTMDVVGTPPALMRA